MVTTASRRYKDFYDYIPLKDDPRVAGLNNIDPYKYSQNITSSELAKPIIALWKQKLESPFYGITSDGHKKENLFHLEDENAPTAEINLTDRRKWSNPEFIIFDVGVRLDQLSEHERKLVMKLLRSALSKEGYEKVLGAIQTNAFLGELCESRAILNDCSYFVMIFGTPSVTTPWGFAFFGHHTSLNFFFLAKQMTISPVFIGAEPNIISHGPHKGLEICVREEERGLMFMQSLPQELQAKAQIYKELHDREMPADRWNPADQRHLGGAFQDNRVIPYEGILVSTLSLGDQEALVEVISSFLEILPHPVLTARLAQVRRHFDETYFCWIGGYDKEDSFYYRVQSPVICVEFDHHSGVFLTNSDPKKYHVHTIIRTPNGNDYGREWLRLYREANASNDSKMANGACTSDRVPV
ncbi:uncharacterized protein A1O5_07715 [Cladophialophora psammophila CBS 110553]|uniref:DUF3500 domain-containing protein n=1 Tax=Cladophialophora psammophila CBS 110553 TaxID=1182543 RepID=W9XED0_9EURO|nr:uncharacterized protein A1O5_07715 [Cladophialophora psammophila CBS 110553]EXJ68784.1 hypothetical protein A1O5_07715 [Cladophialophora psammophila CBS 110553]